MTVILGIDPGSRITGYAMIRTVKNKQEYIASGCIRVKGETAAENLRQIYVGLKEIIQTYQPEEAAVEQVFMHKNPSSALKLGQARGAALVACAAHDLVIAEYATRQVKLAVVGYGAAEKNQVQRMVCAMLNLSGKIQADAADALAVAICHANSRNIVIPAKRTK